MIAFPASRSLRACQPYHPPPLQRRYKDTAHNAWTKTCVLNRNEPEWAAKDHADTALVHPDLIAVENTFKT